MWKSVNPVVALTEQERMKDDVGYASAISCLCTHECTLDDMDLFNTHVIKTVCKEEGIDMGLDKNIDAIVIVHTNLL